MNAHKPVPMRVSQQPVSTWLYRMQLIATHVFADSLCTPSVIADSENAVATAVILTLDHVSPPVSPFFVFHHSRCYTASSLFASKCLGERYVWMAPLCDLWDPGWGDPRFPHWTLLLLSPSSMAPFVFFPCCLCGHTHDDTQDVIVHLISQSW